MAFVKYCPRCIGEPYTRKTEECVCPYCGGALQSSRIEDSELAQRDELVFRNEQRAEQPEREPVRFRQDDPFERQDDPFERQDDIDLTFTRQDERFPVPDDAEHQLTEQEKQWLPEKDGRRGLPSIPSLSFRNQKVFEGRISNYNIQNNSERNFFVKLYEALAYGQRTDDTLHTFALRLSRPDPEGRDRVHVSMRGRISGGSTRLSEGEMARITGSFNANNQFIAEKIELFQDEDGYLTTTITFERDTGILFKILMPLVAVFLLISLFSNTKIGSYISTWIICFVAVLIFMRCFLRLRIKKGTLIAAAVVSLFVMLLLLNVAGMGTQAGTAFWSLAEGILPIVILVGAIIYLIKTIR